MKIKYHAGDLYVLMFFASLHKMRECIQELMEPMTLYIPLKIMATNFLKINTSILYVDSDYYWHIKQY